MKKNWLDFGDLVFIFKVIGQRLLKNALSALYLLKRQMNCNQTCTDIYLGDAKELVLILLTLIPIFKVTRGQRILKNDFSALYLMKRLIDFNQTCTDI